MPPRLSSGAVPTRATAKPRARKSARSEEAEPTPAQKQREERKEVLRKIKQRQAPHRETPSQLEDNSFIVEAALFTHKRPAYPAYEESPNKRKWVGHGPKTKKRACRAPWVKDPTFKKPFSPSDPPVGTSPRDQDPIDAMGRFGVLPTEVRDEIMRYLLLWPYDIAVFSGWGRVFPRSRPRLHLSIMYTCRVLRDQGLRILFGENKFEYAIRDPVASHNHTTPVLEKVFRNSAVPINEHGHLIRHIKIKADGNRLNFYEHRQNFENAILKFLPGGGLAHAANLHTITLEVPAVRNRNLEVPICQYLRQGSRFHDALLKLRVQWVHVLAWDIFDECWEAKIDMRAYVKDEQMKLDYLALNKERHSTAEDGNDLRIPGDPVDAACYRPKDLEVMQKRWDSQVKQAVGKLRNLAWRIEGLAVAPDLAINRNLWKKAPRKEVCSTGTGDELNALLQVWREPSYATCTRSSRSRTTTARSDPDIGPSTRIPTKSNVTAMTAANAELGHLNIFQAQDAEREAKLLQAQHTTQENETEPDERGMLTEDWLESLP